MSFGTFEARERGERTCKNSRIGETVTIAVCKVPTFKAGKGLRDSNELKYVSENATIVGAGEIPQVQMLLFISNDASTKELTDATQRYANTVENAKVIQLDCPHYVHDYEYSRISEEIKAFLQERED